MSFESIATALRRRPRGFAPGRSGTSGQVPREPSCLARMDRVRRRSRARRRAPESVAGRPANAAGGRKPGLFHADRPAARDRCLPLFPGTARPGNAGVSPASIRGGLPVPFAGGTRAFGERADPRTRRSRNLRRPRSTERGSPARTDSATWNDRGKEAGGRRSVRRDRTPSRERLRPRPTVNRAARTRSRGPPPRRRGGSVAPPLALPARRGASGFNRSKAGGRGRPPPRRGSGRRVQPCSRARLRASAATSAPPRRGPLRPSGPPAGRAAPRR